MTKHIPLTKDKQALVDDDDYPDLSAMKWRYNHGYAVRTVRLAARRYALYMHRYLLDAPPEFEVDHIDGDRLNNQRSNLRLATRRQNQLNKGPYPNSVSGFKGVTMTPSGKYQAYIELDGHRITLGAYEDVTQAVLLRDAAARQCYGEFAQLNCPEAQAPPETLAVLARILNGEAPSEVHRSNRELVRKGASRYVGVSWAYARQKWRAQIGVGGKYLHLGYFDDEEAAARAYDAAARLHRGPDTRTNFVLASSESGSE